MDTINHADQMRLANLINDNSDDAEIQKKLDQVVELTNSTRDQAAVALHDCHYDVEKAVDMILEGDQAIVENEWKSAGKRKNKNNSSQGSKFGGTQQSGASGPNKNAGLNRGHHHQTTSAMTNSGPTTTNSSNLTGAHHASGSGHRDSHHHQTTKGNNQSNSAAQSSSNQVNSNTINNQSNKQDQSDTLKNVAAMNTSNMINSSDPPSTTSATVATTNKTSSLQQQSQQPSQQQQQQPQQQQQFQQQNRQKGSMQTGSRQQHQRSTRIPESAVEMPNNEPQLSSLNVQFGELDLKDTNVSANDSKGTFQDVLESSRLGRQPGLPNSTMSSQDNKGNRQMPQHNVGRGGSRRPYNNSGDDRRFYYNRGGRQPQAGGPRPYQQRSGPMGSGNTNTNTRGVRTILNRGLQPNSGLSTNSSSQQSSGFPNSIDTWTNSTAEAASKQPPNTDPNLGGVGNTLRVGQWSDVAGNEDWSEEEHWDAKVMETKVFTPSSKAIDGPVTGPKNQSLLTDSSVPSQINLTSKISEVSRKDLSSQSTNLNSVASQVQAQQSSQKPISHMNDIFDPSVAKAVLEQQNLAAMKPKTSIGISQYSKDGPDPKTVLDSQNLSSLKPKTAISMNQYNKEASESLKSLVGISSSTTSAGGAKSGVPSVPPGALPLISQPQYIMGNAYQPAMFPYAYQAPDVHYPVAAPTAGRDQNFPPSVYSPNWWISINGYQQQMSGNGPQQFGFSHNAQQPSSINSYPLLQPHNLDNSDLNPQSGAQSQLQHSSAQRAGSQVNSSKYYSAYQQQMSSNGPQQFGFSPNAQQPSSINSYPLLQPHSLDSSDLNSQSSAQSQLQHSSAQRGGSQLNQSKHYQSWNLGN